jgi:hypothetical protein
MLLPQKINRPRIQARTWAALGATILLSLPSAAMERLATPSALQADFAMTAASTDARYAVARILATADNQGLPFVIVDKKDGRMFVFEPGGQLRGASVALIGLAPGDHSVPGIGERELSRILPQERTTPAGRFLSAPGRNLTGEAVIWINYSEGLSIHRLRPGIGHDQRLKRLTSINPGDNRISLGCVVVDVAFYEAVVTPVLGNNSSMVYVLPEMRPVNTLFETPAM